MGVPDRASVYPRRKLVCRSRVLGSTVRGPVVTADTGNQINKWVSTDATERVEFRHHNQPLAHKQ